MASDTTNESRERYLVPGLQRGLEILRCFRVDRPRITAAELATELSIPRSTVFRLVTTLQYLGFLENSSGREYSLGAGVLSLGFEYIASLELVEHARPILERLSSSTGQNTHLVIRDGREVVVVLKVSGSSSTLGSIKVGTRLPAHATILGRMCIAYLDDAELDDLYADVTLKRHSPQTPATLRALRKVLAQDRERGYGISEQFYDAGICAVAAPIFEEGARPADGGLSEDDDRAGLGGGARIVEQTKSSGQAAGPGGGLGFSRRNGSDPRRQSVYI
jgi:DNA-binding IclR family transcriptional regulator